MATEWYTPLFTSWIVGTSGDAAIWNSSLFTWNALDALWNDNGTDSTNWYVKNNSSFSTPN